MDYSVGSTPFTAPKASSLNLFNTLQNSLPNIFYSYCLNVVFTHLKFDPRTKIRYRSAPSPAKGRVGVGY